jgi:hypothetical protein
MKEVVKSYFACLVDTNSLVEIKFTNKLKPTLCLTLFTDKKYIEVLNKLVNLKCYPTKVEDFRYANRNKSKDKICCCLYKEDVVNFLNEVFHYLLTTRARRLVQIVTDLNELYKTDTQEMDTVNSNNSTHHSILKHINSKEIDLLIEELKTLS